jgi:hypothetical protein
MTPSGRPGNDEAGVEKSENAALALAATTRPVRLPVASVGADG